MKKRLIFVTEALWIGGIETALINLLNRIDYNRYEVAVLVCRASLELENRVNPNCHIWVADRDIAISTSKKYQFSILYHLTEKTDTPSHLHKMMMWIVPVIKWIENRLYIKYVRGIMKNEHFDTAIIYSDRVAEIAIRAIRADKYLMFYHNAIMDRAYHDKIGYKKCEKVIAVSEKKANELKKFRPQFADKFITIHNVVDIDYILRKSRNRPDISFFEKDFNVVTCGRLAYQKAIDWAIIACKYLIDRGYENVQWWIVGGGPEEIKLRKKINEAGIQNHFHLLGMQKNPYPYIANADLYVQTSRYENYSVVILEAMALCKPILATIPAADQQIQSGVNGLLCDAEPLAIADSIEYLIERPQERRKYVCYLHENSLEKENEKIMQALYTLF